MKASATPTVIASLCILVLAVQPAVMAQSSALGCTLGLPASVEGALDSLLLGACERHDLCWRAHNPCGGPYLGAGWKANCDLVFLADLTGVCVAATTILSFPLVDFANETEFLEDCEAGAAAAYAAVSAAFPFWHSTQCIEGCNLIACQNAGLPLPSRCCPDAFCECFTDQQCDFLPAPEWGTWECVGCMCILTNSPLVLHLADYFSSTDGDGQSWWKDGFCGSQGPTVCLDWRGEGDVTCTAWTSPQSDVAFVVGLSADDVSQLAVGLPVRAEPWRHFFGNVTRGPNGDFPYANGFEALADHCDQDADAETDIDLIGCDAFLHVWVDRSADGFLDPDEFLEFQELDIKALTKVRKTGKKDRCGNTFQAESHATCYSRPGRCGTWLDVFFESRYPEAP